MRKMIRTVRIALLGASLVMLYPTLYLVGKRDGVRMLQPQLDEIQKEAAASSQKIAEEMTCTRDFAAWKNTHQRWGIDLVSTYPDKSRQGYTAHGGGYASQEECEKYGRFDLEMNASMIEFQKKHPGPHEAPWPKLSYACAREW